MIRRVHQHLADRQRQRDAAPVAPPAPALGDNAEDLDVLFGGPR
ncbi:hypothetical protein [Amycolatopsis thermoflava]